ncbi:response regulator transcription factor [Flavivirga algicola]|uniref:HTH luxR-type domain-containing protein n=1 Tax=Flavivirga algicola TaxID=2729136 RepID=A0ABX1RT95_9FLAO|nr:hypothetical protein [Flavivirga algicola]NMH85993.1 hypothetical protein [Flavivirga algicola]
MFNFLTKRNFHLWFLLIILCSNFCFSQEKSKDSFKIIADQAFEKADKIKHQEPRTAIDLFQTSIDNYTKANDTASTIRAILKKAYVFETNAEYPKSYDLLWKALLLGDQLNDVGLLSVIYHRLGRIYSYYKREHKSIEYLIKALQIQKEIEKGGSITKADLVPYYYSIASTYRELNIPKLAQKYLDTCFLYYGESKIVIPRPYLEFEKSNLLYKEGKGKEALKTMEEIYPWFKENQPSYLVHFYKSWGDIYLELSDLSKSEAYYEKALTISKEFKSHIDFTPLIYERLTELYLKENNFQKAYANLKIAKDLDAKFFDSRSLGNQPLLEIKDEYRIVKEEQEKRLQEQYLKQLEQEDKINKLQRVILLGSIVFLLLLGFLFFKHLRAKHKTEKELINKTKEIEIQKARELLELKNKELAASALQLIEKDEFLKDLKSKIRVGADKLKIPELNKLLRSVSVNNNKNWDEFRLRFIEVNKGFYDKIFEKYPNLSQGDQKVCALIKLNFSSKEMARLLGISVESVHTSRHRIRKKMELPRNINLEDYISSL